ncbi:hypothetical protein BDZ45DRAFT_752649 [Acephala macrosclerotiorum]|nr:hypothetical protein BDZ45DRAFT_752649 [Acephala macrosclerotiorum]
MSDATSFIEHVEGLGTILGREFPQFPKPILSYIKSSNAFASGNSLAPQWQNNCGLSFLENYLRIESESPDDSEDQLPGYHLGTFKIRSMPLAVWTGGHLGAKQRSVPVVMVIGNWDQQDIMQFVRHYEGPRREEMRLRRLMESHEWIYHDLFSTFMDWNEVWDNVRDRLGELDYEVHHRLGKGDILGRIQSLNKATATNIMLRETLNIQKNSLDTVIKMVTKNRDTAGIGHSLAFVMRGEELLKALEHYWTLAHGNKEQLQNLVSMMLSLEQISQGQSVGRLNILAFTFLPLSFVASIFGMTQFTISPTWYPVYALPLLSLTLVIAILLPKLISIWDNWKKPRVSNLRRRSKARTAQHNLGRALKNLFLKNEESCLPTRRLSRPRTSTRRGRSLEKATKGPPLLMEKAGPPLLMEKEGPPLLMEKGGLSLLMEIEGLSLLMEIEGAHIFS